MNRYRRTQAKPVRTALRLLGAISAAARSLSTPHVPVEQPAPVQEPTGLFTADEMPQLDVIEDAAADYDAAAELARRADRGKRAARKILDRLPVGVYGGWQVERVQGGREVADLDRIREIFKAHGLGQVPMKTCAASLKVSRVAVEAVSVEHEAELLAA